MERRGRWHAGVGGWFLTVRPAGFRGKFSQLQCSPKSVCARDLVEHDPPMSTAQYSTVQTVSCHTVSHSTAYAVQSKLIRCSCSCSARIDFFLCGVVAHCKLQCCIVQYSMVSFLFRTAQYSTAEDMAMQYSTVQCQVVHSSRSA